MHLRIELTESDVVELVRAHIQAITGCEVKAENVAIQTKSKQNYRAEWGRAAFRAVFEQLGV